MQIGITVIGAAAAAFGGARIAADLAPYLEGIFGEHAGAVSVAIVVAAVSFLSLVLGELVPKSLALRYADTYAFLIARPLLRLAQLMRPLVWFLTACSNVFLRLFGDRTSFTETRMSPEELCQVVEEAAKTGSVDPRSSEIATRALELGEVMVAEAMVRRDRIAAVPRDTPAAEVQRVLLESGHNRLPVYDGDLDHIIGYVTARDVLGLPWEQQATAIAEVVRPLFAVPLTAKVGGVLRDMQARRIKIAVVVDEHGGTAGLVTAEDLVEEIVGDIFGEDERPEEMIRIEPDGTALVPGWCPTRKVNRAFRTALPITRDSTTIAGLCLALALAVPTVGSKLQAPDGTVLEVVDASPRRVRTVRLHRRAEPPPSAEPPPAEPAA